MSTKQLTKKVPALKGEVDSIASRLKTEGFSSRSKVYCSTIGLEPLSELFSEKSSRPPIQEGQLFKFLILNRLAKYRIAAPQNE